MPGDDLIEDPHFSNLRTRSIAATPSQVWPWLAQMGLGRAGWYSYDWVDNFGRTSARELRDEWMVTAAGEPVPAGPLSFDTPVVEVNESFVIAVLGRRLLAWTIWFTLAYRCDPVGDSTLLVTRARGRIDGPLGGFVARRLLGPGDGIMVRRQLRGIAERATALQTPDSQ